ncbi:uncharacterized protein LOC116437069 [Corvus moneduloides]|uniref:uncharacterized protein LOC116437069 n=1 Tax=Corvus moneduloides TaxID=1196302 RepID=UPI0013622BD4|nr:uncharacterized protein LOC116437069 [Corvus moneduloides]
MDPSGNGPSGAATLQESAPNPGSFPPSSPRIPGNSWEFPLRDRKRPLKNGIRSFPSLSMNGKHGNSRDSGGQRGINQAQAWGGFWDGNSRDSGGQRGINQAQAWGGFLGWKFPGFRWAKGNKPSPGLGGFFGIVGPGIGNFRRDFSLERGGLRNGICGSGSRPLDPFGIHLGSGGMDPDPRIQLGSLGSDPDPVIQLGSGWDPVRIQLGSGWDLVGIRLGSGWDLPRIRLGSGWDPVGIRLGSASDPVGIRLGSVGPDPDPVGIFGIRSRPRDPFGIHLGSVGSIPTPGIIQTPIHSPAKREQLGKGTGPS